MLLERYLTDLVTTHFGHIVRAESLSNITISAWNGSVTAQNVELCTDETSDDVLLHTEDLPLQIAYGKVGTFSVQIPWKVLRAQLRGAASKTNDPKTKKKTDDPSLATTVVLKDVNILLTPRRTRSNNKNTRGGEPQEEKESSTTKEEEGDEQDSNSDELKRLQQQQDKQQSAQTALDAELLQRVAVSSQPLLSHTTATENNTTTVRWKVQEFAKSLLSNLTVKIQNIHIRYEDPGTCLGFNWHISDSDSSSVRYRPSFAIGITLREFSIQSSSSENKTNNNNDENDASTSAASDAGEGEIEDTATETVDDNDVQYKLAAAKQLAAYWDSDVKIMAADDDDSNKNTTKYFEEVFAVLNDGGLPSSSMTDLLDATLVSSGFQSRHSFVLDPFSPSIHLGLAPPSTSAAATNCSSSSTMEATLPPCRFNLSKSLLEDVGYLRKSWAVWMHAKKGLLLPDETLRRLTKLRPTQSATVDPSSWWKYAYAAVLALREENESNKSTINDDNDPSLLNHKKGEKKKRKIGWLGLSRALAQRRRYIDLYKQFLGQEGGARIAAHTELLAMEGSSLTVAEIVAFRIATYTTLRDRQKEDEALGIWELIANIERISVEDDSSSIIDSSDSNLAPSIVSSSDKDILSIERRSQMFTAMAVALNREQRNLELQAAVLDAAAVDVQTSPVHSCNSHDAISWKTSLKCPELSLQVNDIDRNSSGCNATVPVVRVSCAFAQDQDLYHDGSWEMTNRIGSLVVEDRTVTGSFGSFDDDDTSNISQRRQQRDVVFPNLLGPKGGELLVGKKSEEETMTFDGTTYLQSILMKVQRVKKWEGHTMVGSTTTTTIRVLPFEVVYSTAPVESLSRILDTANLELANDYHRVAGRMSAWRERQRKRLLEALAHKQKEIYVDVDVGAPVLLFPENSRRDSPLLVVDLGKLHFSNNDRVGNVPAGFDDKWRLELASIQVQCSSTYQYRRRWTDSSDSRVVPPTQQLIEPFALNFDISTKIRGDDSNDSGEQTAIQVLATLPRLAFNITSSAVRLLRRLQKQWRRRKQEVQPFSLQQNHVEQQQQEERLSPSKPLPPQGSAGVAGRTFEFQFIAPLLAVKFENDVDGHGQARRSTKSPTTLLFDLVLKGMEGEVLKITSPDGSSTLSCGAKVRALGVADLYQRAGDEFSLLLSSVSPELVSGRTGANFRAFDTHRSGTDLVMFEYKSIDKPSGIVSPERLQQGDWVNSNIPDKLSIHFNELYVEWNPETLAAINVALSIPDVSMPFEADDSREKSLVRQVGSSGFADDDDDEFFDAEEDAFYDAESVDAEDQSSYCFVSEIAESERSSLSELMPRVQSEKQLAWPGVQSPLVKTTSPSLMLGSQWLAKMKSTAPAVSPRSARTKPFEVVFKLSKLRVNFNKEARHRRLVTAEMDGTSISYTTLKSGGSKTVATIGNLTFSDCESLKNKTLYREILGLKTDARSTSGEVSSLFEMEMITKPRARQYVNRDGEYDDPSLAVDMPVVVDYANGSVHGFDNFLRARFSPMRFVYLQQIWFEIVDYFFVGIIGNDIWGKKIPSPSDLTVLQSRAVTADKISFTRFDVVMDSPMVLFPVSSCSTDYIRLEASCIAFKNRHSVGPMRHPTLSFLAEGGNQQWYNNCEIDVKDMNLRSCSENDLLNKSYTRPTAQLSLCWPIGPSALANVPKWKVECDIDAIHLVLDRAEYALMQHIVQYNIGDESHHLDEWYALQSLPPHMLRRYRESIMVHFGYDQKDGTPSTFDVSVSVPLISFLLKKDFMQDLANVQCSNVYWKYEKFTDRVSKQKVMCDTEIKSSGVVDPILYSYQQERRQQVGQKQKERVADLTYTTATEPSGNNTKTLTVVDSCIRAVYPAWCSFAAFFQSLPQPSYLSPNEAIQVGDKWYRIGGVQAPRIVAKEPDSRFDWIDGYNPSPSVFASNSSSVRLVVPSFEFRFLLIRPSIRLGTDDTSLVLSINSVNFRHHGRDGKIARTIKMHDVEVQTQVVAQEKRPSDFSLIKPWTVESSINCCNGKTRCTCQSHSIRVSADTLQARASFSDLTVALDVGLVFLRDIKSPSPDDETTLSNPASSDSMEISQTEEEDTYGPQHSIFQIEWNGLCLVVADDSGRHFFGEQDLVALSLVGVHFIREEKLLPQAAGSSESAQSAREYSMRLQLSALDVADCLQSEVSPFRSVLTIEPRKERSTSLGTHSTQPSRPMGNSDGEDRISSNSVEVWSIAKNEFKSYGVDLQSIELQYNPSMVVALQRFLGRLAKEARKKHDSILSNVSTGGKLDGSTGMTNEDRQSIDVIRGTIKVRFLSVCLNKEHQGRRLLEATLSQSHVDLEWSSSGYSMSGLIGELEAIDPSCKDGLCESMLRSSPGAEEFIKFRYQTFSRRRCDLSSRSLALPKWIHSHIVQDQRIDDFLDVSIGTVETVFLLDRTAEIMDYLSNGMPGKGMGATSQAAKGFVSDRIRKRSFFNIHVDAPKVIIPQSKAAQSGLALRLGDFNLSSWISVVDDRIETSRMLKVLLSGVSCSLYRHTSTRRTENCVLSKIDITLDMQAATSDVTMSCRLTDVVVHLAYTDFVTVLSVQRENIGRKLDKKIWDNLEAAWEKETEIDSTQEEMPHFSNEVTYSTSARLVRYGRKKKDAGTTKKSVRLKLFFGSLSVVLRRDDYANSSMEPYDIILTRCQGFELDVGRKDDGDHWLNASLNKIYVFDLGSRGRNFRREVDDSADDSFAVVLQGYTPPERSREHDSESDFDSQIILKIENDASINVTKATLIVSCLSGTVSFVVLREVMQFFACEWTHPDEYGLSSTDRSAAGCGEDPSESGQQGNSTKTGPGREFQLRLVLHYPRLVFVADENDHHSRALVLRGLAIANACFSRNSSELERETEEENDSQERTASITLNADFQNLSSYMYPDISDIVEVNQDHVHMFDVILSPDRMSPRQNDDYEAKMLNEIGVPLLLPLTVCVEFEQTEKGNAPKERTLGIIVDPLSLMLSNNDVQLVKSVLAQLSSKPKAPISPSSRELLFDVVFQSQRLGLGLRKDSGQIVVDYVGDLASNESSGIQIETGDALHSINGEIIRDAAEITLSEMVNRLTSEPRPITVTFSRKSKDDSTLIEFEPSDTPTSDFELDDTRGNLDKIDVSLSAAVLTLMEKEVPLFRGSVSASRVSCELSRARDQMYNLHLSTSIGIDYYNLRIWGWEPFVEPSVVFLSGSFQEPYEGPRELAVEVGDRGGGLCVNLTDSLGETLGKLLEWREDADEVSDVVLPESYNHRSNPSDLVARHAANAAFRFATRQKNDTAKPFVFRNRVGLSIAFAQNILRSEKTGLRPRRSLISVGGYAGLQDFEPSEIAVVASDEDLKFRVESLQKEDNQEAVGEQGSQRFPSLTVALQESNGVVSNAFENLQISRPGETLLPLTFSRQEEIEIHTERKWVTWLVEQVDEKTIITLGSSIRVVSMLGETVDLGIEVGARDDGAVDNLRVRPIGAVRLGEPFCLPIWLATQLEYWRCCIKLSGGYRFAPLFDVTPEGVVKMPYSPSQCVECRATSDTTPSAWLAVSKLDEGGIVTISIDCSISVRNMLPTTIDWEIGEDSSCSGNIVDGSTVRAKRSGKAQMLGSGEQAEVLSEGYRLKKLRVRPESFCQWSSWSPLILPMKRIQRNSTQGSDTEGQEDRISLLQLHVKDAFNVPLPIGLRIARTACGLDATLYADFWCTNCTPLNLVFGCSMSQILLNQDGTDTDDKRNKEISAAEATLKEISSLFESGEGGTGLKQAEKRSREMVNDVVRLAGQVASYVTEECFEYLEVEGSMVLRRWWASENPFSPREKISNSAEDRANSWIDKAWNVDYSGNTNEGWETSPNLAFFSEQRVFNSAHRYRRRRWTRTRLGLRDESLLGGVSAYFQASSLSDRKNRDGKRDQEGIRVAVQVDGGKWSVTSLIPTQGSAYGVIRVARSRWPEISGQPGTLTAAAAAVLELCYAISPLDGDWGLLTRSMLVTSRFLLRNDSSSTVFEVKQTGASDSTAIEILPGQTSPFHWGDFRLPQLISVRPFVKVEGRDVYKWSGGFDPLTIGPVPVRIRKARGLSIESRKSDHFKIQSIKVEVEIRPRTGGTGINLSFQEEDAKGDGSLFRVENMSTFPIWLCQDGILANPLQVSREEGDREGDMLGHSKSMVFSLDVPYRQGKYSHRKAATMAILLRARIALAPLSSRAGIETTKVVSLAIPGERVRLNPSKLTILSPDVRMTLQHLRVVGIVNNDGPTRVLTFRLMELRLAERSFQDQFQEAGPTSKRREPPLFAKPIVDAAFDAIATRTKDGLPSEEEAVRGIAAIRKQRDSRKDKGPEESQPAETRRDALISFRAAFSGFVISLVDSAPSEIAVITLKNMNAIATWDMLRATDSTVYITVTDVQVDNMVPNSPFPVAVYPYDKSRATGSKDDDDDDDDSNTSAAPVAPLLVIGLSFAPRHKSGIVCLKSATIAPRNLAIRVDLAFLVRLQKFALEIQEHFREGDKDWEGKIATPNISRRVSDLEAAAVSGVGRQKIYFGGLTILPCNIKLSVAPARALTPEQAALEGSETAAIHRAVRKGDVLLDRKSTGGILGVKVGSRNKTPLAVVRGMFKSFVVDGLLRLNGATINFSGVSLRNYTSTGPQLTTALGAHYMASLRQNLPSLLGSMAAFGNPLGLVRGLGEGVGDFVLEPVKGFQRSVQEMDASYLLDGVARGTLSLARHTVGGFADSAAMLAETFSKNMTVLTLDRRYAQKRDRGDMLRNHDGINVAAGLGSGVHKLVTGFLDGVTGVVKAPIRGAEKRGLEGFAKGIGKGLLGLLVKPIIGISDGFTDVMIGVKGSVDGAGGQENQLTQVRPRRALYGREKAIRSYYFADAAASALMLRTRLAGEPYLSHVDMDDRVALLSSKRVLILGRRGEELLILKLKHIESVEIRSIDQADGSSGWGIIVLLNTPRRNGSEVEVISCKEHAHAVQLCSQLKYGMRMASETS